MFPPEPQCETVAFRHAPELIDPDARSDQKQRDLPDPAEWRPISVARSRQPIVQVELKDPALHGQARATALIDSGAAVSLVNKATTDAIAHGQGKPLTFEAPAPDLVHGVGGPIKTRGATLLDVTAGAATRPTAQFTIVDELPGGVDVILSHTESRSLGLLSVHEPPLREEPNPEPPGEGPEREVLARPGVGPKHLVAAVTSAPLLGTSPVRARSKRGRRRRRRRGRRRGRRPQQADPPSRFGIEHEPPQGPDEATAAADRDFVIPRATPPRPWRSNPGESPQSFTKELRSELAAADAVAPQQHLVAALKHSAETGPHPKALPHVIALLDGKRRRGTPWPIAANAALDMLERERHDAALGDPTTHDEDDAGTEDVDLDATQEAVDDDDDHVTVAEARQALLEHAALGKDDKLLRLKLEALRDALVAEQRQLDAAEFGALAFAAVANEHDSISKLRAACDWLARHEHVSRPRPDASTSQALTVVAAKLFELHKDHIAWDRACRDEDSRDDPLSSKRAAYRRARIALLAANLTAAEALANGLPARGPLCAAIAAREAFDAAESAATTCTNECVTVAMNIAAIERSNRRAAAVAAAAVATPPEIGEDRADETGAEGDDRNDEAKSDGPAPGRVIAPLRHPLVFGEAAWAKIQSDPQSAALAQDIGDLAAANDAVPLWKDMQIVNTTIPGVPLPSTPLFRPHMPDEAYAALREHMAILEDYGVMERIDPKPEQVPGWTPQPTPESPVAFIPTFVIYVPGKKPRIIADAREVNKALALHTPPVSTNTPLLINKLADPDFFCSSMDLAKAYPQCGVSTTRGLRVYLTDPRGGWWLSRSLLTGGITSPGILSAYLAAKLSTMDPELRKYVDYYADNLFAATPGKLSGSPEAVRLHLRVIKAILEALNAGPHPAKLTLEERGSVFMVDKLSVLGFDVSDAGASINPERLIQLQAYRLEFPPTFRRLRTLLGRLAYINNYVPALAGPCQKLQPPLGRKNAGKVLSYARSSPEAAAWFAEARQALTDAIDLVERAPPMAARNRALRCALFTDGSRLGKGVVLCDVVEELPGEDDGQFVPDSARPGRFRIGKRVFQVVHVASTITPADQQHHSAPILELRALLYGLTKMRPFWAGSVPLVFTDSLALAKQISGGSESHMALRTLEALHELGPVEVVHVKGEHNPADVFSRLSEDAEGAFTLNMELVLKQRIAQSVTAAAVATRARAKTTGQTQPPSGPAPSQDVDHPDRTPENGLPDEGHEAAPDEEPLRFQKWKPERTRGGTIVPPIVASGTLNAVWTPGQPLFDPEDPALRAEVLRATHAVAHEGVDGTVRRVRRDGFGWPSLIRDARALLADCRACVTNNITPAPIAPATVYTNEKTFPGDIIHMDSLFFSHDNAGSGESRAAVIIDRFSGFVAVYQLRAVSSTETANAMLEWITNFGAPRIVITDGGSEYQGEFAQLLSERGIALVHGTPYNKTANSLAENIIKVLRGYARKLSNGDLNNWVRDCKAAASAHNSRGSTFLSGTSPAEVFLGRRIDLNGRRPDIERDFRALELAEHRDVVLDEIAQQATRRVAEFKAAVGRDEHDRTAKAARLLEERGPPTHFEPGQLVLVKVPIKKFKMQPAYNWPPRRVHSVSKVGTITLERPGRDGPDLTRKYRPHDLKLFHGSDPGPQFVVEDILEARWSRVWGEDNRELPAQVMYKVRWEGYSHADDTWQAEEDLPKADYWVERMAALRAALPTAPPKTTNRRAAART